MTAHSVTFLLVAKRAYGTGSLYEKNGCWYGRWRTSSGQRKARKIGDTKGPDALTKKQAEAKLREAILTDTHVAVGGGTTTVRELGLVFKSQLERAGRKPSHIESVGYHLSAHINPLLGDLPASQVIEDDVRRLVDRLSRQGRAPKTIRNVVGTLHSVLEVAVDGRLLERNPVSMKRLPEVRRSRELRYLTPDELRRVLAAEPGTDEQIRECFPADAKYGGPNAVRTWWPVVRLLILTAAVTGMRLGELRALRWRDLDMRAVKVRVTQSYVRGQIGTPKSEGSSRAIPLASWLITELERHHMLTVWNQESDLVLAHPVTGRPLDRVRLGQHFKAALRRAEVRPVRIHDLRHTFATTMAASGDVSVRTLQEWMGHEDLRTTQIYAAYMPGERDQQIVDGAFGSTLQFGSNSVPEPELRHAEIITAAPQTRDLEPEDAADD